MTEADLEGGLRLSRASGWNQTLADWRLLLSLGPGLFRVALRGERSGGLGRCGPLRRGAGVDLHDPRPAGRARPRSRHARLRRGAGARERPRERRAAPRGRPRRDARGPRPLPAARLRDGPALVRLRASRAAAAPARARRARPPAPTSTPFSSATGRSSAPTAPRAAGARGLGSRAHPVVRDGGARPRRTASAATEITPISSARSSPTTRAPRIDLARAVLASRAAVRSSSTRASFPRWLDGARATSGFREQRPLTRMYLGEARPPARPEHELAILGPEFG